jgi:hypothetical protein
MYQLSGEISPPDWPRLKRNDRGLAKDLIRPDRHISPFTQRIAATSTEGRDPACAAR